MSGHGDDAKIVDHLAALSPNNYQRRKIQQKIDETLDMAATSVPGNKILLNELQKLRISFEGYSQYIDNHVENAMSCIEKTPSTDHAKKRRDAQADSLVNIYLKKRCDYGEPVSFTRPSNIPRTNEVDDKTH